MAQVNQPLVALPRITEQGKIMELWIANDYNMKYSGVRLKWKITNAENTVMEGEQVLDIPAGRSEKAGQTDLSKVPLGVKVVNITMELFDSGGDKLSSYEQEVYLLAFRPEFQEGMR